MGEYFDDLLSKQVGPRQILDAWLEINFRWVPTENC